MIRGLYTAASGMLANQRRQETLINNMSNAHKVGFKEDETALRSFPEMLISRVRDLDQLTIAGTKVQLPTGITQPLGTITGGVYAHEISPRFSIGPIQRTEKATDVAIALDAINVNDNNLRASMFFTVQGPNEEVLYTRDGQWTINDEGLLSTYGGSLVLDADGNPIEVAGMDMRIDEAGRMTLTEIANPDNVEQLQLGLVMVEDPSATLVKGAHGYYRTVDGEPLATIDDPANFADWQYVVSQGALEGSNVNVTRTMTQMIETMRYYEANQKVLVAMDGTLQKAATEIGRV